MVPICPHCPPPVPLVRLHTRQTAALIVTTWRCTACGHTQRTEQPRAPASVADHQRPEAPLDVTR